MANKINSQISHQKFNESVGRKWIRATINSVETTNQARPTIAQETANKTHSASNRRNIQLINRMESDSVPEFCENSPLLRRTGQKDYPASLKTNRQRRCAPPTLTPAPHSPAALSHSIPPGPGCLIHLHSSETTRKLAEILQDRILGYELDSCALTKRTIRSEISAFPMFESTANTSEVFEKGKEKR